ncbi:hypothetical protein ABT337_33110 [Saccharopolyspora hirsuta]|uniref:Secreted protein n=1 Tax=Saccharopolyspora hirsuta TaxID=1837 RepID=A0A5M7BBV8_SACHI|nr:hypothetical protein [Saccharopolyspora hirsuta]KAA5824944.1 hypothetical protein F1721_33900 [Saccharopolyspora hirsuta]
MRLRATAAAALGAAGMLLSLPGSALAAEGEFYFKAQYQGREYVSAISDPAGRICHRLAVPENSPAYQVRNETNATAVVFLDSSCATDTFFTLQPGQTAPRGVLVRSVLFSD